MKAITTKFSGPTGGRGARITATDGDYRVVVPYEYNNAEAEHRAAAVKLCKTKWRTDGDTCDKLIGGGTKAGRVFVPLPPGCACTGSRLDGARRRRRRR
jgi:hypothetical protein